MEYPLLSLELAQELEMAEAEAAVACAERIRPRSGSAAAILAVGGGFAVYCGANSPVTQAVGLGLNGPCSKEEFDRLEEFYFCRNEPVRVETCPLVDATLLEHYRQRGYFVTEFSNVMVRPMERMEASPTNGIEIQRVGDDGIELWTLTVAQGFAENYAVTKELLEVMKLFASAENTECFLARIDGQAAGGGTLAARGRIAGLFGASTLPGFRGRGVQSALLQTRIRRAWELGCELGMSLALPGSASHRNITRKGFRTLYTRMKFERAVASG